jgi:hypothetical protein
MKHAPLILALALALALLLGSRAQLRAASGGGYTLGWSAVGAGGGVTSGGSYTVVSTIGQPAAGAASGGKYTLVGGFAGGIAPAAPPNPTRHIVYLPLIRR